MTATTERPASETTSPVPAATYRPGVCNIGPAEIAKRRRSGHVGLLATAGLWVGLVLVDAPRPVRFLVALPAAGSAAGYLQARLRFCAGFGSLGVYNFGDVGRTTTVGDREARARDRARALQIGLGSVAIGAVVGLLAVVAKR